MVKRYTKKRNDRPKAPFIRSFGYIFFGALLILILAKLLTLPSYDNSSDYIGAALAIALLGGLGLLGIIVGIKKRRW